MNGQGPLSNQTLGGKYVLGELLGQGGFGAVYRARHTLLNRQQAVKILLEHHFTSPKFRERFIREAQTLAALDHPNIVHVDDFGFEGNRAYLVMPYIGGGSLQRILRARGPLPLEEAMRYLEQICPALDYAHTRNVAHLDLKPLNLLVHEDGRLLLSDFGLAHLMEQGAIEGSTSLQFGTPTYMAPEHLQGQPERRSDLYALGIILYQMLAGRVPFEGSNAAAIMLKHLTEPPPPLHPLRSDLPPALDTLFARALAKRTDERYQSAGALLAAFKVELGGRISHPRPGMADAPTQLSPTPLTSTLWAAKPLAGLEEENATIQAASRPKGSERLSGKKAPEGLLSRKSVQRLSLIAIAFSLLNVWIFISFRSAANGLISGGSYLVVFLLALFLGLLGLIRSAKMKTWGWFTTLIVCPPLVAVLLAQGLETFLHIGVPIFLILISIFNLLIPLTTLIYSRRS